MYVVVGCPSCGELWIRETGGKQSSCPSCRRSHDVDRLRSLYESEDIDAARDARTRLLAERAGADDVAGFSELETPAAGPDDDADELASFGLDPDEIAAVGTEETDSRDRRQIVLDAIVTTDEATADRIVEAAAADGVPADAARSLLVKLRENGEITESDGQYRPV